MGFRCKSVRILALWVLTTGFLCENVRAFTTAPRLPIRTKTRQPRAFGVTSFAKEQATLLYAQKSDECQPRFHLFRRNNHQIRQKSARFRLMHKFRRAVAIMWTATLLWFGGARLSAPPSYASTTSISPQTITSRVIPKGALLDQIVDRYVKDHMFDDDVYDPLESAYVEAYDDAITGKYPRALNEVASSLLGTSVSTSEKATSENLFISMLSNGSTALQKLGLSSTLAAIIVYAATLVGIPSAVLIGILSYANAQKRMRIRQNKKRYGADYSLDATIKVEEDIEAPDDDEFDDEDDEEGDEDDEDDDEDDDE